MNLAPFDRNILLGLFNLGDVHFNSTDLQYVLTRVVVFLFLSLSAYLSLAFSKSLSPPSTHSPLFTLFFLPELAAWLSGCLAV